MKTCREVSKLVSESFDRRLRLWERTGVWLHFLVCKACPRFRRQLQLLHRAGRRWGADPRGLDSGKGLSPEARERIGRQIDRAQAPKRHA